MAADGNFWLGVAGLGYTAGTLILGRMIGIGRKVEKLEAVEQGVNELQKEVEKVTDSMIQCQRTSEANRGITITRLDTTKHDLTTLSVRMENHHQNRDVHTDREWRQTQTDRLEAIANSIGERIGSFEKNISNQLDSVRNQIRINGNGRKETVL
jgi:hypothetical protein